jgi:uncharacterized protein (DUF362 family)/Pyruvate/2-oxoacid:ferredoxin oxidoreductase delta subunit
MAGIEPNNRSTVAIVTCDSYEESAVLQACRRGLELLGGPAAFFKPGERIVLKPNVLFGNDPERCITTHPSVFKAVASLLLQAGVKLSYGDSPGGVLPIPYNMEKAQLAAAARQLGIELADFDKGEWVSFPRGLSSKKLLLANAIRAHDGLVSLPKLKTHGLVRLTGAVKNQYGCVPGMTKGECHARFPDVFDFSRLLVDITACIRPRLYVMDAIMAMEGNGPHHGTPAKVGVLLLSADPVALDATACRIVNLDPGIVPTNPLGQAAGLGSADSAAIRIVGEEIEKVRVPTFKVVRQNVPRLPQGRLMRVLKNLTTPRPRITAATCTRCGMCIKVCPIEPKAVDWAGGQRKKPPVYNYTNCIRCFCCQEMCPAGAIRIKTPLLRLLLPPLSYFALMLSNQRLRIRKG